MRIATRKIMWPALLLLAVMGFSFKKHKDASFQNFALVELYTSEGCSSCPPADALLAKIQQEYRDKNVYVLGYHVDYWNRLGWKDEFSSAEYSTRQRRYANLLHSADGVYTPQAIVNGKTEFVGSEDATMHKAINKELSIRSPIILNFNQLQVIDKNVTVPYHITGDLPADCSLMFAVVKRQATTAVKAGENKGYILKHVNVVFALKNIPLKSHEGVVKMTQPATGDLDYVGFIQDNQTGHILALQSAFSDVQISKTL